MVPYSVAQFDKRVKPIYSFEFFSFALLHLS
jgi:hypothetical protein